MRTCIVCRFEVCPDDIALMCAHGHVICVGCYARVTETEAPMPKDLRRDLTAALAGMDLPSWMDK